MLMREFLTSELLHGSQHLLRGRARRHREDNIECLSRLSSLPVGTDPAPRMRRPRYRSVIERPLVDEFSRRGLPLEHLTLVGLDIELAMAIDILEMRLHTIRIAPTAGDLHENFFGAATRRPHALSPSCGRLPSPTSLASEAAGIDAPRNISRDPERSFARHRGPARIVNSR